MRQLFGAFSIFLAVFLFLPWAVQGGETASPFRSYMPLTPIGGIESSRVLIGDLFYDGYAPGDVDEAFSLWNMGRITASLKGWSAGDGEGSIALDGVCIPPHRRVWIAREAAAFSTSFGFPPDYEYGGDTMPSVPDLQSGRIPRFGNSGDELIVSDDGGHIADALAYGKGHLDIGWDGPALQPYSGGGAFAKGNQILARKFLLNESLPALDTDSASDWVQAPGDPIRGRRPIYPGWDRLRFWMPARSDVTSALTLAITPDNAMPALTAVISEAHQCICYEGYTLDSAALARSLAAKASSGVSVTLLLEGSPYGGIGDDEKWCVQQIENSGGRVFFMVSDRNDAHARYRFLHSKMMLVDDIFLGIGTENLSPNSFPEDDLSNGTAGRRGVWAFTDSPVMVERAEEIWHADFDPHRQDIFRWDAVDEKYGAPPVGYAPTPPPDWDLYKVQFTSALTTTASYWTLLTSPEAALRPEGIVGLMSRAGAGDEVMVEELEEPPYWGEGSPNPRLQAYFGAARRGAKVRLLLDSFFDRPSDPNSNSETARWTNDVAAKEGLDLEARLGNPTRQGIHNKMVLARIDGESWISLGSLNGSETSSKANRETWIAARSDGGYAYLSGMFEYDWNHADVSSHIAGRGILPEVSSASTDPTSDGARHAPGMSKRLQRRYGSPVCFEGPGRMKP